MTAIMNEHPPLWYSLSAREFLQAGIATIALGFVVHAQAADLLVMSGGGAQRVLQTLAPQFQNATGNNVRFDFSVVGAIQKKLMAGEKADVVLLPLPLLNAIEKAGAFRTQSRTVIGRIGIGVVVREGVTAPDISNSDAVRKMLLETRSVAFPDPMLTPSGKHLMGLFAQMDIAEAMQPKITLKNAIDGGVNLVRDGKVELGLFLVTEILPVKGVKLVGTLPASLQGYVVYAAAVAADSGAFDAASQFVKFISGPDVRSYWKTAGFEPPSGGN
jgi:molybdate transport system substrate-binding protein